LLVKSAALTLFLFLLLNLNLKWMEMNAASAANGKFGVCEEI